MSETNYDLVPTRLAVAAMRDNGYKNTAYAVAELIDNSIQAGATRVELLAGEVEELVQQRKRSRIREIAVLDNGCGMDSKTLRIALQFGNGSRLGDRSGIGRFGMGLPSASISQAQRVEVWSWTDSPERANYTFIDLAEIEKGKQNSVPEPIVNPVPEKWYRVAEQIGNSGTLVVWTRLDRVMWRKSSTIIDRSEYLIGRMYRRYLHEGKITIRLAEYDAEHYSAARRARFAEVNDPIYLMNPSSTPAPYDTTPMFQPDGDLWAVEHKVPASDGTLYPVTLRFTVAKDEVRKKPQAGNTPYGKHAKDNIGVSLMRAGRELDLDQSLVNGYDPRERWWGVEVDFPPALDELFGVTNNKQAARHFSEITSTIEALVADDTRSAAEMKDEMEDNDDPAAPLVDVVSTVVRRLRGIREVIKIQAKGQVKQRLRHLESAEAQATEVTKKLQEEGRTGESDAGEALPDHERVEALQQEFEETGLSAQQAREISEDIVRHGAKYSFAESRLDGGAFFNVRPVAGEIIISLNINHPAYTNLVEVLQTEVSEDDSRDELASRLTRANHGLRLLLMAWARYEDEEENPIRREALQDIRTDWGRVASRFMRGS
ncbi:ATP-binding protein [Rhodococcus aetherivorans]|uniref:ATP-binding protein n=1 Tax=Rhodococcus aetherivorans TaxID=191292 RepID=UPI001E2E404D|nr:ATP-binding protein [Rhodococcus aetherivorans]UGQ39592.1 ATP-binding protein [Rhodococcus aetherivorans]